MRRRRSRRSVLSVCVVVSSRVSDGGVCLVRDKYGGDLDSSSSSEEEDEAAEGLTSDVERDFLRTLSLLKSKDPSIYDSQKQFYTPSKPRPPLRLH